MEDPVYCARFAERLKRFLKERYAWANTPHKDRDMTYSIIDAVLAGEYPYQVRSTITHITQRQLATVTFDYQNEGLMVTINVPSQPDSVTCVRDIHELYSLMTELQKKHGVRFKNTVLGAIIKKLKFKRCLLDKRGQGVDW